MLNSNENQLVTPLITLSSHEKIFEQHSNSADMIKSCVANEQIGSHYWKCMAPTLPLYSPIMTEFKYQHMLSTRYINNKLSSPDSLLSKKKETKTPSTEDDFNTKSIDNSVPSQLVCNCEKLVLKNLENSLESNNKEKKNHKETISHTTVKKTNTDGGTTIRIISSPRLNIRESQTKLRQSFSIHHNSKYKNNPGCDSQDQIDFQLKANESKYLSKSNTENFLSLVHKPYSQTFPELTSSSKANILQFQKSTQALDYLQVNYLNKKPLDSIQSEYLFSNKKDQSSYQNQQNIEGCQQDKNSPFFSDYYSEEFVYKNSKNQSVDCLISTNKLAAMKLYNKTKNTISTEYNFNLKNKSQKVEYQCNTVILDDNVNPWIKLSAQKQNRLIHCKRKNFNKAKKKKKNDLGLSISECFDRMDIYSLRSAPSSPPSPLLKSNLISAQRSMSCSPTRTKSLHSLAAGSGLLEFEVKSYNRDNNINHQINSRGCKQELKLNIRRSSEQMAMNINISQIINSNSAQNMCNIGNDNLPLKIDQNKKLNGFGFSTNNPKFSEPAGTKTPVIYLTPTNNQNFITVSNSIIYKTKTKSDSILETSC